jgi:hypothetical protein
MKKQTEEHSFSIEITKDAVKTVSFMEKNNNNFLFEGFLGKLKNVAMVEDVMLEIEGKNGIIKLDITPKEIKNCIKLSKKGLEEVKINE